MSIENSGFKDNNPLDQNVFDYTSNPFYQAELPDATAVLVLGILSIPACSCYGIGGAVLSIIALVFYSKSIKLYNLQPNKYTTSSYNNLKAGRICAILGLIFSCLVIFIVIIEVIFLGSFIFDSNDFNDFIDN
jgi:M penetrans paralogue family 26